MSGSTRDPGGRAYQGIEYDADNRPFRVITVTMEAGLSVRILPDRGLDIADCWYRGLSLHWDGWAPAAAPATGLYQSEWEQHFFGGLLTTCGLCNVGEPSEGHGLHGRYNHLPAKALRVEHVMHDGSPSIVISGSVSEETLEGGLFKLKRTITLTSGVGQLSVEDVVTNEGVSSAPAPILYHLNFGGALLTDDCEVSVHHRAATVNEFGDWKQLPGGWQSPCRPRDLAPVTVEHLFDNASDEGTAKISSPTSGVAVTVSWDRRTVPRLMQWINMKGADRVIALEPANCGTKGRGVERAKGTLPILEAGESRISGFVLKAEGQTILARP